MCYRNLNHFLSRSNSVNMRFWREIHHGDVRKQLQIKVLVPGFDRDLDQDAVGLEESLVMIGNQAQHVVLEQLWWEER